MKDVYILFVFNIFIQVVPEIHGSSEEKMPRLWMGFG